MQNIHKQICTKSRRMCSVSQCSSYCTLDISLHKFPTDPKLCMQWKIILRIGKPITKYMSVCSKHFLTEDFMPTTSATIRKHLKRGILPSQNIPVTHDVPQTKIDQNRTKWLKNNIIKKGSDRDELSEEPEANIGIVPSVVPSVLEDTDPLEITTADSLSLFGDSAGNIEFVIESDEAGENGDDEVEDSHIVIQVAELNENDEGLYIPDHQKQLAIKSREYEDDSNLPNIEEIKEEIDIDEEELQIPSEDEAEINQSNNVVQANKTIEEVPAGSKPNTRCYVPNCTVGKEEPIYWFKAPKDLNLRKIWDTCIDRPDKGLDSGDVICHKHFSESDVILTVDNRSKICIKSSLREGAIPCIKFHEECCVPGCDSTSDRMFTFPVFQSSNLDLWLYLIKNLELKKLTARELLRYRVCKVHFEPECFENDFTLKSTSAPTLYLPVYINPYGSKPITENPVSKSKRIFTCAYGDCKNNSNSGKVLFKFPWNPDKCMAWLRACRREGLISTPEETVERMTSGQLGVCELHFEPKDFLTSKLLKSDAVPKVYKDVSIRRSIAFSETECQPPINNSEEKYIRTFTGVCSYRDCHNKESMDNPFFFFPSDEELLEKWLRACRLTIPPSKGKMLQKYRICSKHFQSHMFASKHKLKPTAVPTPYKKEGIKNVGMQNQHNSQLGTSKRISCAVRACPNTYGLLHGKGRFPDPSEDIERFNIWVRLVANPALKGRTPQDIYNNYMVCLSHFEPYFFMSDGIVGDLHKDAVPTKCLRADMKWLFSSDYYKNRLQNYEEILREGIENADTEKDKEIKEALNTTCILEEDGLKFPATGHFLYMEKKPNLKRKFPYEVYKLCKTGYELNDDLAVGENIKIHTAIIIDDDDEVERQVLQQLLNKKRTY